MSNDLYSAFFIDKPELESTFKEFGERFKIPVTRKLKSIEDKDEFLATIIEYRFGVLFGAMFKTIEHERKAFPGLLFTPDWTITSESQTVVAEVVRLNASQRDYKEMQFSDSLIEALQTLSGNYVVQLKYEYEEIKDVSIDYDKLKISLADWLKTNPQIGEILTLDNNIGFKVTHKDVGLTHVGVVSAFRMIKFDYRRLSGENSRLFSKLKYADAVNEHELPYLICMHLSFESNFDPEDMYKALYGCSGIFHGEEPFEEYYPNAAFHTYIDGLYYTNDIIKTCVSGILVYHQGDFTFFPNYSHINRLNIDGTMLLNKYLCKDLKA